AVVSEYLPQHGDAIWHDCDPIMPIPNAPALYLPRTLPAIQRRELVRIMREGDAQYRKEVRRTLWRTLLALKSKRDPRSRRWRQHMPIFIAGGASRMPFYQKTVDMVSAEMQQLYPSCTGIQKLFLDKPDELEASVSDSAFHRLAV